MSAEKRYVAPLCETKALSRVFKYVWRGRPSKILSCRQKLLAFVVNDRLGLMSHVRCLLDQHVRYFTVSGVYLLSLPQVAYVLGRDMFFFSYYVGIQVEFFVDTTVRRCCVGIWYFVFEANTARLGRIVGRFDMLCGFYR